MVCIKQAFNVLYRTGGIYCLAHSSTFDNKTANMYVKKNLPVKDRRPVLWLTPWPVLEMLSRGASPNRKTQFLDRAEDPRSAESQPCLVYCKPVRAMSE